MTGNDTLLNDLLDRYRQSGDRVSLEDLCKDRPDLLPELQRRVAALRQLRELAELDTSPVLPPQGPPGDPTATPPDELAFLAPAQGPGEIGRLGPFRVLSVLGRGGMGLVLLAEDPALGREVAIKVMGPELASQPEARARFLREAQAAARVDHPHVVPIHQVAEAGVPFLVMPRLHGRSLAARLQAGRPTTAEAIRIAREMAEGLAAAHERGVVHRDVKPPNVWLKSPGDAVVLLDFGLAHVGQGEAAGGSVQGTPAYMAPEQADGRGVGPSADLFSLGCVLYEMLTGRKPFDGPNAMAVLRQVGSHTPPPLSAAVAGLPMGLPALVDELLAKRPNDRPSTAAEVARRLREIEAGLSPEGPPPRRSRAWVALVIGGLAFAVSAAALWFLVPWKFRRPPGPPVAIRTMPRPLEEDTGPVPIRTPPRELNEEIGLTGEVDLRVYPKDGRATGLQVGLDPRAVPAREGDQLRLEARFSRPVYVYILWIDPKGAVVPLYPWSPGDDLEAEKLQPVPDRGPTELVNTPASDGKGWPLDDTPGLETVLVLARRTPWPKDRSLEELIGEVEPSRFVSEKENNVQTFVNGRLVSERARDWASGARGPKGKTATDLNDPLLPVIKRLAPEFELIQAARFAHVKR